MQKKRVSILIKNPTPSDPLLGTKRKKEGKEEEVEVVDLNQINNHKQSKD